MLDCTHKCLNGLFTSWPKVMTSSTTAPVYLRQDSGISACLAKNKYIYYENNKVKYILTHHQISHTAINISLIA